MSSEPCPLDSRLRLHAGPCRGGFDFTLLFEETILAILPLAFVMILAPLRILYLSKKSVKVAHSTLLLAKLVRRTLTVILSQPFLACSF